MKNIQLQTLKLRNFKGIKKLDLDMNGADLKIYGDNGTGKTTIFDGFLWLLFGKDSNNRADFAIKTLDAGKEINNLEHEVSADFTVDGLPLSLRKVYKERWTKKRGAPIKEFTGHETDHEIDGVPVKKKEYEERVGSIVKEEVFKLLTNPLFFNEQMKWQDRRKALLEVCGDIEEEDIISFNPSLKGLPAILKGRTIEDHRKVIASRRAEINKELERIPVRISEVENSIPETTTDVKVIADEVTEIESKLDENATLINNIRNGAVIVDRQQKLRQVDMDIEQIKRNFESDSLTEINKLKVKLQEEQSNLSILQSRKGNIERQKTQNEQRIAVYEKDRVGLREKWAAVNARAFDHKEACACPTCGQELPEEQLKEARDKALSDFNLSKAKLLEDIQTDGKDCAAKSQALSEENQSLADEIEKMDNQAVAKQKEIEKLTARIAELQANVKDVTDSPEYLAKLDEKASIQADIQKLQANAQDAIGDIDKSNAELRHKRAELNALIAQQAQAEAAKKRIIELEEQQKELATEYEKLEGELFLTEEFIRSKVELLTEKINSKFKYARFKLFDTQINGGLQEVCETTFEGVPYSSGLNNAARINVGIDIINTLTDHFGIKAPIFVDNAEAVTRLIDTDSQLISLVVSEPDKQLRVESQSSKESEVA
ncbi:hypothetical protein [Sporosarcina sp. ITBMC105]